MALSDSTREQLKQLKADVEDGFISEEDFKKQKELVLAVNNQELQAASGLLDPLAGLPRATAKVVAFEPASGPPQVTDAPARGLLTLFV